jgi:hypothetical protein
LRLARTTDPRPAPGFFCVSRLLVSFQRSVAREPLVTLFTQLI